MRAQEAQRRQSRIHFHRAGTLESRHHIFGEEVQTHSFCYVGDWITDIGKMMDTPGNVTALNLGNPEEFTIAELDATILDLTGSRSKIVHRPLPENQAKQLLIFR